MFNIANSIDITAIRLTNANEATDEGSFCNAHHLLLDLMIISKSCPNIQELFMPYAQVTDVGIAELVAKCKNLKKLNFNFTGTINDRAVKYSMVNELSLTLTKAYC
jgi:hypothetical protein